MLDFNRDVKPYLELDAQQLPPSRLRHAFYQASIDHRDHLRQVFGKAYPDYLDIARPKEREEFKTYRKTIYKNPLRSLRRRVVEVLDYVRQADDYDVAFKESTAADSLESFVTNARYSKDGTASDWFWKNIRKKYVGDPNAVLVVLPLNQPKSDTERVVPVPMLIDCERVYQFRKGEFAVLESSEKVWIDGPKGLEKTGKILLFLDHESYCVATQKTRLEANNKTSYSWDITGAADVVSEDNPAEVIGFVFSPPLHNCPEMPARKLGKLIEECAEENSKGNIVRTPVVSNHQGEEYFESILADSLPHVKAAQSINSDIEVERNFHVSSQEWRFGQKRCSDSIENGGNCDNGNLVIRNAETGEVSTSRKKCPTCKGSGMDVSGSGLGFIIVSPPQAGSLQDEGRPTNLPIPPGGYIPRPIEALIEFVKEFEREKRQSYETINMQWLMETPYEESGTSKKMDREELYRQLITEGAHLCLLELFLYVCSAYQRKQEKDIPAVLAPVRLSIENSEITRQELGEAVDKKFDKNLRSPLEKKLIEYQAGKDSDYYRRYELREQHDPYADLNLEEKLFLLATARATMDTNSPQIQELTDGINLSINFNRLVSDELRTNRDTFWSLAPADQYNRLLEGARKLTGKIKTVQLDPKTGQPAQSETQLVPIVDVKNFGQLG